MDNSYINVPLSFETDIFTSYNSYEMQSVGFPLVKIVQKVVILLKFRA